MDWYVFSYDKEPRKDYDDYVVESKCFSEVPGQPASKDPERPHGRRSASIKDIWQHLDGMRVFADKEENNFMLHYQVERGEVTEKDKFLQGYDDDEMVLARIPGFLDGPVYADYFLLPKSCLVEETRPETSLEEALAEADKAREIRNANQKEYEKFLMEEGAFPRKDFPLHLQMKNDALGILVPDPEGVLFVVTYGGVALKNGVLVGGFLDYSTVQPEFEIKFSEWVDSKRNALYGEELEDDFDWDSHPEQDDVDFENILEEAKTQARDKRKLEWDMTRYRDFTRCVGDNVYTNDRKFNKDLMNFFLPEEWKVDERFLDQAAEAWVPVVRTDGQIGVLTWPNSD